MDTPLPYDINLPYQPLPEDQNHHIQQRTEFPEYLPVWERGVWFDDFPTFEYHDPAQRADKKKPHLFGPTITVESITPKMGTILTGVKLEKLTDEAKDELALLICERKVVVLRDQLEFLSAGPQFQADFMTYYGKLSHQPVTGTINGFPQFHIIHRDDNEEEIKRFFEAKMTSTLWHHDVSYERQPPGYIMLGVLACPDVGGDTIVADTVEAYNRLSPLFQGLIDHLKVIHTSEKLIAHAKAANGLIRSNAIESIHPLVRVHPITSHRSIFLNMEWTKGFIGLKDLEAEAVTKFLMDHVRMGHDFQARIHWKKHSIVMFDGRTTLRKLISSI
jgi:sulfonate dioxygenase